MPNRDMPPGRASLPQRAAAAVTTWFAFLQMSNTGLDRAGESHPNVVATSFSLELA
jgi:hypothetical protein